MTKNSISIEKFKKKYSKVNKIQRIQCWAPQSKNETINNKK